ncbi:hypothetical protein NQ317_007583 [Molorchus minor]|uniref:U1-C C2H2-type zinc finger domain-containing protein n=1 Tax=Molorchus minor TaxID=1323400 RepID=A0ABQ9JD19_9CUCU|nr:hypothetical protein NQ317_007583 [Molorchus minor]
MRRRFYCDYCDKSFIDDVKARKRHLESNQHIKLKKYLLRIFNSDRKRIIYTAGIKSLTILKEELLKTPCKRFLYNHNCPFEGICKQTHYSPEQLCELRQQGSYSI